MVWRFGAAQKKFNGSAIQKVINFLAAASGRRYPKTTPKRAVSGRFRTLPKQDFKTTGCRTGTRVQRNDPTLKANRVANYAISMREEVELIAHSCGVLEPHKLGPQHAYLVDPRGQPTPLSQ